MRKNAGSAQPDHPAWRPQPHKISHPVDPQHNKPSDQAEGQLQETAHREASRTAELTVHLPVRVMICIIFYLSDHAEPPELGVRYRHPGEDNRVLRQNIQEVPACLYRSKKKVKWVLSHKQL